MELWKIDAVEKLSKVGQKNLSEVENLSKVWPHAAEKLSKLDKISRDRVKVHGKPFDTVSEPERLAAWTPQVCSYWFCNLRSFWFRKFVESLNLSQWSDVCTVQNFCLCFDSYKIIVKITFELCCRSKQEVVWKETRTVKTRFKVEASSFIAEVFSDMLRNYKPQENIATRWKLYCQYTMTTQIPVLLRIRKKGWIRLDVSHTQPVGKPAVSCLLPVESLATSTGNIRL